MYIVTVTFIVEEDRIEVFRAAVLQQANASLRREPECKRFDVGINPDDASVFFLYEIYVDKAAFESHLETEHFQHFDRCVAPWVKSKEVRTFEQIGPDSN